MLKLSIVAALHPVLTGFWRQTRWQSGWRSGWQDQFFKLLQRFALSQNLCSRCTQRSRGYRIGLAGVFLWAALLGYESSPARWRSPDILPSLSPNWIGSHGSPAGWQGLIGQPRQAIAADLAEIRSRGYLIVGVKENLRPLGFRDATGTLQGFEIDVARQLAADLLGDSTAIEFVPLMNVERLAAVYDRVDVTIAQVGVTESRERVVQFSLPYLLDGTALITQRFNLRTDDFNLDLRRDELSDGRRDGRNSIAQFNGRTIAVLENSPAIAQLRYLLPAASLVAVDSYQAASELLAAQRVAAFAGDRSVLIGWTQEDANYAVVPGLLSVQALAIAMPRGMQYDSLRRAINTSLEQWRDQGWLEERSQAWGLVDRHEAP